MCGALIAFRRIRNQAIKRFARLSHTEFIACAFLNRLLAAIEVINFSKKLIVTRFKFGVCSLLCRDVIAYPAVVVQSVFAEPQRIIIP